jgi:uncharacterized protein YggU (UPF0235/DUF167 family)
VERTRLALRVAPGSGKPGIVGRYGHAWKLRVTEPPEGGRANDAVLRLLARTLALPRAQLRLVAGQGGRNKVVELTGVSLEDVERKLAEAGEGGLS